MFESFADLPGTTGFFSFVLQIAPRQVDAQGVAVDMCERVGCLNIAASLAHGHHEFNFVMQVAGHGRVGEIFVVEHEVVGIFLKEKWQFTVRVMTHFARMFCVVAAHAVNAANGITGGLADHANRHGGWRGKNVVGVGAGHIFVSFKN